MGVCIVSNRKYTYATFRNKVYIVFLLLSVGYVTCGQPAGDSDLKTHYKGDCPGENLIA